MAKSKLPAAKDWRARQLSDWNVTTFHAYLIEMHTEKLKVDYFPFGKWVIEKKLLKNCIDQYGREITKEFIDECLRTYKPNPDYPGINFGFMFKYKNNILQRIQLEKRQKAATETRKNDLDEDWI